MRIRFLMLVAAAVGVIGGSAMAGTYYSVSSGGDFYVSSSTLIKTFAQSVQADPTHEVVMATNVGGYADSGIVLEFDGSLKLGNLNNVTVTSAGVPLSVNLWLDTGGDGNFFAFDGPFPGERKLTGLNSDSYLGTVIGTGTGVVSDSSSFYGLGGNGAGGTYTLAQLKSGSVNGIGTNTPVALWIGMVGTGQGGAVISDASVNGVSINPVPLPGAASAGIVLLGSLGGIGALKRLRRATVC